MMRRYTRLLAGLLSLCCLLPMLASAQGASGFSLIDVPETVEAPEVTIRFRGENGVSYTLHYKYRNIWLLPTTETVAGTEGAFEVSLGAGKNDFVLVESTQPRDAADALAFSIEYQVEPVVTPTPEPTETPTPSPSPTASPTPTPSPSPTPTPTPSPTPSPSPTPEPTETPAPDAVEPEPVVLPTETPEVIDLTPRDRTIGLWSRGEDVLAVQEALQSLGYKFGKADGVYGPRTRTAVSRFQRAHDLKEDGLVGDQVRAQLAEYGYAVPQYVPPDLTLPEGFDRSLSLGKEGMDVYRVQERLIALGYLKAKEPDQVYGRRTRAAVRAFQKDSMLQADGVAGAETLRKLFEDPGASGTLIAPTEGAPAPEGTEAPTPEPTQATAAAMIATPTPRVTPTQTLPAPTHTPAPEPEATNG